MERLRTGRVAVDIIYYCGDTKSDVNGAGGGLEVGKVKKSLRIMDPV